MGSNQGISVVNVPKMTKNRPKKFDNMGGTMRFLTMSYNTNGVFLLYRFFQDGRGPKTSTHPQKAWDQLVLVLVSWAHFSHILAILAFLAKRHEVFRVILAKITVILAKITTLSTAFWTLWPESPLFYGQK